MCALSHDLLTQARQVLQTQATVARNLWSSSNRSTATTRSSSNAFIVVVSLIVLPTHRCQDMAIFPVLKPPERVRILARYFGKPEVGNVGMWTEGMIKAARDGDVTPTDARMLWCFLDAAPQCWLHAHCCLFHVRDPVIAIETSACATGATCMLFMMGG